MNVVRWPAVFRAAYVCLAAAVVGFLLVGACAVYLLHEQEHQAPGMGRLALPVHFALAYLAAFPASWVLLRLASARPAWLVALLGWLAVMPVIALFDKTGGLHRTAWAYGLQGALAYGTAGLAVMAVAWLLAGAGTAVSR